MAFFKFRRRINFLKTISFKASISPKVFMVAMAIFEQSVNSSPVYEYPPTKEATSDNDVSFQLGLELSTNHNLNNACTCCSKLSFIRRFSSILSSREERMFAIFFALITKVFLLIVWLTRLQKAPVEQID